MTFLRFWASSLPVSAGKCIASSRGPTGSGIRKATGHVFIFAHFCCHPRGSFFGLFPNRDFPGRARKTKKISSQTGRPRGKKLPEMSGTAPGSSREVKSWASHPSGELPDLGIGSQNLLSSPEITIPRRNPRPGLAGAGRSRRFRGGKKWNFGTFPDSLGRGRKYSFPPKGAATETPRTFR